MKSQTTVLLSMADEPLSDARKVFTADVPHQAARLAYFAQFHAARALIHERTSTMAKTHNGVNAQFHRLVKDEPAIDRQLTRDLAAAYHYKELVDYGPGEVTEITVADAADAIATADNFLNVIRRVLSSSNRPGGDQR